MCKFNILFKLSIYYLLLPILLTLSGCNGGGSENVLRTDYVAPLTPPANISYMSVNVSANNTGVCSWYNMPCVSVQICDTSNPTICATVDNVLLDTGSYGLRVFASALPQAFVQQNLHQILNSSNQPIAEIVNYGDGDCNWGPVVSGLIKMDATDITSSIPLQLVDSSYLNNPFGCSTNPQEFGSNGILGVGPYPDDSSTGQYYIYNGQSGSLPYSPIESQVVKNPVAYLSNLTSRKGITIALPQIGNYGGYNAVGYMTFGVNSAIVNSHIYPISPQGILPITMPTSVNELANIQYGFLDTGSNGLFFITPTLASYVCNGWYCPPETLNFNATNLDVGNVPVPTEFSIINAYTLFNTTNNNAASNLGGRIDDPEFTPFIDYGLPFFFGKQVQICFDGSTCNGRAGPYWSF
jgi:hypothetical protein